VAAPPLDLPCDGPVTYPGDIKTLRIPSKGRSGPTLNMTKKNHCIREKNRSREYSKGNKTVPGKVAKTHTEDGHKQDT
jgi:hypothetical protein